MAETNKKKHQRNRTMVFAVWIVFGTLAMVAIQSQPVWAVFCILVSSMAGSMFLIMTVIEITIEKLFPENKEAGQ